MRKRHYFLLAAAALVAALPLLAQSERINYEDINKIKAEGMQRSEVMELNSWLSDVYAPRLTGSPMFDKAATWVMGKMKEWGLANVKMEAWTDRRGFDRGWTNDKFYMEAVSPNRFPIPGTPTAWTPGTNGLVSGEVVLVTGTTAEELAPLKGKLKGKWIITQAAPDVAAMWEAPATRYTPEQLAALEGPQAATEFGVTPPGQRAAAAFRPPAPQPAAAPTAGQQPGQRAAAGQAAQPAQQPGPPAGARGGQGGGIRSDFLRAEGVLGVISTAPRGHGMYTISGNRSSDPATTPPAIVIAAEQYGRVARMLAKNIPVTIEADIKNTYYPKPQVYNIVGEIPGSDKADEVVMLGAHLDTWHAATGAADNGNGSAAMMEAMRILEATGVRLRRTVRIALWGAEEQGLIGSYEYVSVHYVNRPVPASGGPGGGGQRGGRGSGASQAPLDLKPEHSKFSVYFNIDNGTGAIRGIYTQGNDAVVPIFREWIEPFRSLGMTAVTTRNTGGTDHQSFDRVGLPAFQFIQDEIEYDTVTHHTNMDTYERLQPRDNMQMATIAAGFAYLAANRDELLPRKPPSAAGQGGRGRGGQ
jgi:carboxypeptidase Q